MREQDTQCTNGEFSSTVNAALKKNFARVSSFTAQQIESWKSLFLRSNYRLIILPTGHNLRGCTRPDIALELAACGFSQWEGNSLVLIVTPLLGIIMSQVE